MKIITADERLREKSGAKILLIGPSKIGKTSQLRTLDPQRTLFIDLEAGDLAVRDWPVATLRPQTWPQCRDLACFLTGPNPSLPPTACYSQAHYDAIRAEFEGLQLDRFDTYFVDSLTVVGRLCFRHSEQQPEAFSDRTGRKDVRALPTACTHAK
jgi:AAA domain